MGGPDKPFIASYLQARIARMNRIPGGGDTALGGGFAGPEPPACVVYTSPSENADDDAHRSTDPVLAPDPPRGSFDALALCCRLSPRLGARVRRLQRQQPAESGLGPALLR